MKNLPISVKFLAILGMLALFAVAAVGFAAQQMYDIGAHAQKVNRTVVQAATDLADASGSMEKIRAAMEYILLTSSDGAAAAAGRAITVSQTEIDAELNDAAAIVPSQSGALQALQSRSDALLAKPQCQEVDQLAMSFGNGASQTTISDFSEGCARGFVPVTHAMEDQRTILSNMAADELAGLKVQTNRTVLITLITMLGGFILVALIGYFGMGQWVVKPLGALRAAMARLAKGDLDIVLDSARRDEVGAMARSVQVFRDRKSVV